MTSGLNDGILFLRARSTAPRPEPHTGRWFYRFGWLFPRNAATSEAATSVHFQASPETVWQRMLSYEEVPVRPPLLLRVMLPRPLRTEGDKTRVGAAFQCTYTGGGHLVKLIQVVEPPHLVQFKIIEQRLGIEGCITLLRGSYELRSRGHRTQIVLTTNYRGHLRPRYFWRPLERFLAHRLHRHILEGMRASLLRLRPSTRPTITERSMLKSTPP